MGVDELSMNAKSILPVRKIIRSVDLSKPLRRPEPRKKYYYNLWLRNACGRF